MNYYYFNAYFLKLMQQAAGQILYLLDHIICQ